MLRILTKHSAEQSYPGSLIQIRQRILTPDKRQFTFNLHLPCMTKHACCQLALDQQLACRMLEDAQQKALVRMLALAVKGLHERGVVHGALTPDACHWFGARNAIKLGGFGCWAMAGSPMPVRPALRYAPPEVRFTHMESAWPMRTLSPYYTLFVSDRM